MFSVDKTVRRPQVFFCFMKGMSSKIDGFQDLLRLEEELLVVFHRDNDHDVIWEVILFILGGRDIFLLDAATFNEDEIMKKHEELIEIMRTYLPKVDSYKERIHNMQYVTYVNTDIIEVSEEDKKKGVFVTYNDYPCWGQTSSEFNYSISVSIKKTPVYTYERKLWVSLCNNRDPETLEKFDVVVEKAKACFARFEEVEVIPAIASHYVVENEVDILTKLALLDEGSLKDDMLDDISFLRMVKDDIIYSIEKSGDAKYEQFQEQMTKIMDSETRTDDFVKYVKDNKDVLTVLIAECLISAGIYYGFVHFVDVFENNIKQLLIGTSEEVIKHKQLLESIRNKSSNLKDVKKLIRNDKFLQYKDIVVKNRQCLILYVGQYIALQGIDDETFKKRVYNNLSIMFSSLCPSETNDHDKAYLYEQFYIFREDNFYNFSDSDSTTLTQDLIISLIGERNIFEGWPKFIPVNDYRPDSKCIAKGFVLNEPDIFNAMQSMMGTQYQFSVSSFFDEHDVYEFSPLLTNNFVISKFRTTLLLDVIKGYKTKKYIEPEIISKIVTILVRKYNSMTIETSSENSEIMMQRHYEYLKYMLSKTPIMSSAAFHNNATTGLVDEYVYFIGQKEYSSNIIETYYDPSECLDKHVKGDKELNFVRFRLDPSVRRIHSQIQEKCKLNSPVYIILNEKYEFISETSSEFLHNSCVNITSAIRNKLKTVNKECILVKSKSPMNPPSTLKVSGPYIFYHLRGEYDSTERQIILMGESHTSDFCSSRHVDKQEKAISVLEFIKKDLFSNINDHEHTLHVFLESNYEKKIDTKYFENNDAELARVEYYFDACTYTRRKECNLKRTQVHNVDYRNYLVYSYVELFSHGIQLRLIKLTRKETISKYDIYFLKKKASLIVENELFLNNLTLNNFLDYCCEIYKKNKKIQHVELFDTVKEVAKQIQSKIITIEGTTEQKFKQKIENGIKCCHEIIKQPDNKFTIQFINNLHDSYFRNTRTNDFDVLLNEIFVLYRMLRPDKKGEKKTHIIYYNGASHSKIIFDMLMHDQFKFELISMYKSSVENTKNCVAIDANESVFKSYSAIQDTEGTGYLLICCDFDVDVQNTETTSNFSHIDPNKINDKRYLYDWLCHHARQKLDIHMYYIVYIENFAYEGHLSFNIGDITPHYVLFDKHTNEPTESGKQLSFDVQKRFKELVKLFRYNEFRIPGVLTIHEIKSFRRKYHLLYGLIQLSDVTFVRPEIFDSKFSWFTECIQNFKWQYLDHKKFHQRFKEQFHNLYFLNHTNMNDMDVIGEVKFYRKLQNFRYFNFTMQEIIDHSKSKKSNFFNYYERVESMYKFLRTQTIPKDLHSLDQIFPNGNYPDSYDMYKETINNLKKLFKNGTIKYNSFFQNRIEDEDDITILSIGDLQVIYTYLKKRLR